MVTLGRLAFWKRDTPTLNEQDHFYATNLFSSENSRQTNDVEMRQALGTNIHMIEDEGLLSQIEAFSKYPVDVVTFETEVSPSGAVTSKTITKPKELIDWNMVSLRVLSSKVIRTSWIDPKDADIYKEELEYAVEELKENLSQAEYQRKGPFYDAVKFMLLTAIDDAVNGRKARLLKVQLKGFELSVQHQEPGRHITSGAM